MLEKDNDNAVWFDYIKKLHDREIERRRNSGFTAWAILGFAIVLIYRVLD